MTKAKPQHDWKKAQPHDAVTGRIVTRKKAENNPAKVEWVTGKKPKGNG